MASGTRTRSRDRSRTRGSGTPGPGSAQPPSAAGASPQGPGGLHLRTHRGQGGAFRLQRLVLLELAAAVLLVGWAIAPMALVPHGCRRRGARAARLRPATRPFPARMDGYRAGVAGAAEERREHGDTAGHGARSRTDRRVRPDPADLLVRWPGPTSDRADRGRHLRDRRRTGRGRCHRAARRPEPAAAAALAGAGRARSGRYPAGVGAARAAHPARARAAPAPALGGRHQLRAAAGADRRPGGAHHLDRAEARPRAVPGGRGRARRRAHRSAEVRRARRRPPREPPHRCRPSARRS